MLPARTCPIEFEVWSTIRSIWPATRSFIAGPVPRYGTYCSLRRATFEIEPGDVASGARAGGAGRRRRRLRLQPRKQFLQRRCRNLFLADDDHRIARQQGNRFQIGDEVVAELVDRAVGDVGTEMAEADRVAVGRRAYRAADADRTARPRDVLDQHRFAERGLH